MRKVNLFNVCVVSLLSVYSTFFIALVTECVATVYYVSPSGIDTNNGLTRQTPFRTLSHASKTMLGGDELVLMDGTYIGSASENILSPPSGVAPKYTQPHSFLQKNG